MEPSAPPDPTDDRISNQLKEYRQRHARRDESQERSSETTDEAIEPPEPAPLSDEERERRRKAKGKDRVIYPSVPPSSSTSSYPSAPPLDTVPSAPSMDEASPLPGTFPDLDSLPRPKSREEIEQIDADYELALRLSREENAGGVDEDLDRIARQTAQEARRETSSSRPSRPGSISTKKRIKEEDRKEWDDAHISPTSPMAGPSSPRPSSAASESRGLMSYLSSGASAVGSAASKAASGLKSWWNTPSKDDFQVPSSLSTSTPQQPPEQAEQPSWASQAAGTAGRILSALLNPDLTADASARQRTRSWNADSNGWEYTSPGGNFRFRIGTGPSAGQNPMGQPGGPVQIDPVALMLGTMMGVPPDRLLRRAHFENERARLQHQFGQEPSYEELLRLGEQMGPARPRGATDDQIDQLPTRTFEKRPTTPDVPKLATDENQTCAICLSEFEPGETITTLPCLHQFHKECISSWLKLNKVCAVCRVDVQEGGVQ